MAHRLDAQNNSPFRLLDTFDAAAAGDYAANDVVSADAAGQIASAVPVAGMVLSIIGAKISVEVEVLARFRLHFFSEAPNASTVVTDNAAFSIVDADRANYQGYMDFETAVDVGGVSFARSEGVIVPVYCAGTTLYYILQTLDAFTNESPSMEVNIQLYGYLD